LVTAIRKTIDSTCQQRTSQSLKSLEVALQTVEKDYRDGTDVKRLREMYVGPDPFITDLREYIFSLTEYTSLLDSYNIGKVHTETQREKIEQAASYVGLKAYKNE